MAETIDIVIPDLGDFADVEVIEVLVKKGDAVAPEDGLITLETDKASMDVPAPQGGEIESLSVAVGEKVSAGDVIGRMIVDDAGAPGPAAAGDVGDTGAAEAPAGKVSEGSEIAPVNVTGARESGAGREERAASAPVEPDQDEEPPARATPARQSLPAIDEAGFARAHASPSVRKLARELGVDLTRVKGSGAKNRILHVDVKAFVKSVLSGDAGAAPGAAALPKVPVVDYAKFGEVEAKALTRIQKISGPRLQASWINLPHVTQHDLADITELEARRNALKGPAKERGIALTPLAFIMRACVAALREFPRVNSSLSADGETLVYKKYIHMGFAADTENGLMVPVIRNADRMDVYELARKLGELSSLAREGKLKAEHLQGASFTISSLGGIGGTAFTPIVNAPEVAILGVSRSSMQPVWDGTAFQPRLMLPLSFSYDHRVIDGAYAVRFTTFLAETLGDVDALLEAIP